jgi:hypothetical protein
MARLMAAACHDAEIASRNKIDQKTACEFTREDAKSGLLSKAMKEVAARKKSGLHRTRASS